ncbi:flagellar hook-associated protein FlgK [Euzebya rosea]|uniref:flagellar hook-associated protein FlgK n=1 Tax=Euzebya rosea TaxID=2052804 RepID=UPI000D3ED357|nr:flagellar hook-associated protein FlgK [Euzebya rosea]
MPSTFSGLSVASSALAAQRRAIEATGHNIANVNTPGYSRQRVDLAAIDGSSIALHAGSHYQAGGVDVAAQTRIVDQFLVNRVNTERAALGLADERQVTLERLELAFAEPGEFGLSSELQQFWSAWDTAALTPEDEAARAALLQRGAAVVERFQSLSHEFDEMQGDVIQRAEATVTDINGIAHQLADLNIAISAATDAGTVPNDLLDQRDQLVRTLSEHVGVSARTDNNGLLSVSIGGAAVVAAGRVNEVSLDTTNAGGVVLRIANSPVPLRPTGGRIEGLLQSTNVLIPEHQARIDALAVQLADVVNSQHRQGQDLDGNAAGNFFAATGARDFTLDAAVLGRPRAIGLAAAGAGAFDGTNAVRMAELAGLGGGPDDAYRAVIAELGVAAQTANQRLVLQESLTTQFDAQREAVSGVSIDEEMSNLVAFQQAYDASARFLTAIDEMIDRLINGTGSVGR